MATIEIDRRSLNLLRYRLHGLDAPPSSRATASDVALLDYGVQDTGPDGAAWALAVRGAPRPADDELAWAWTLRGAPHAYRRRDLPAVAVATSPLSEADAAKRLFDASKPLRAAGIPVLEALATVADHLRAIVSRPLVKGEVSSRLTQVLDDPLLRECRPCQATHSYEMTFRLAALQAGIELEPGTAPPVMRRVPGLQPLRFQVSGSAAEDRFDVVADHLRFYPGARVRDVATFLDAPTKEVKAHWPAEAVEVHVGDVEAPRGAADRRWALARDADALRAAADDAPPDRPTAVRLVGPYDPFLQLRDRELLVPEEDRRKDLWRVLGRPGAVLADGQVLGTWRPRTTRRRLAVLVDPWTALPAPTLALVEAEAERLAAHRGVTPGGVTWA